MLLNLFGTLIETATQVDHLSAPPKMKLPTSALDAPPRLEIVARVSEPQNQFSLRQNSPLLAAFFTDGHSKRGQLFKRRRGRRGSESGDQEQIGRHSGVQSRIGAMNPFLQRTPKRQRTGAVQDLAEARKHVALACVLECGSPLPLCECDALAKSDIGLSQSKTWRNTGSVHGEKNDI